MLRSLALSFAAAAALVATGAHAEMLHLPQSGAPAFVVDAPPSWKTNYDQFGNLQLLPPDHSGFVEFTMLADPSIDKLPASTVALNAFKSAGAGSYARTETASIAGRPGQAFVGVLTRGDVALEMRVVLVKLDAGHYASVTTVRRQTATAAQSAALADLAAHAQLALH